MPSPTNILITKLGVKGKMLAQALTQQGFHTVYQPLLAIQPLNYAVPSAQFSDIIFTSQYAVEYGKAIIESYPHLRYWAIGQGTADGLQQLGIIARYPYQANSEGLIALLEQKSIARNILLVTGEGGRGYLDQHLPLKYNFQRCNVYRREALDMDDIRSHYDIVVLTNHDSLEVFLNKIHYNEKILMALMIVSSQRMFATATASGFRNVVVLEDITNESILAYIQGMFYAK